MILIDDPDIHDGVYACHDDGDDNVHGDVDNDVHADVEEDIHDGVDVAGDVDFDYAVDDAADDDVGDDGSVSIHVRIDKTMYIWRRVEAWWVSGWMGN